MRAKLISFCFSYFPIVTKPKKNTKEITRKEMLQHKMRHNFIVAIDSLVRRRWIEIGFFFLLSSTIFRFPPLTSSDTHNTPVWMKELNDHVHNIDAFKNHRDGKEWIRNRKRREERWWWDFESVGKKIDLEPFIITFFSVSFFDVFWGFSLNHLLYLAPFSSSASSPLYQIKKITAV